MIETHRPKGLRIGAQRVPDDPRVASIILGTGRREAVAEPVHLLWIDRIDWKPPLDEQFDQCPARHLDAHGHGRGIAARTPKQRIDKGLQVGHGMFDLAPLTHLTVPVEHAHFVRLRRPINSHKPLSRQQAVLLPVCSSTCRAIPSPLYWRSMAQLPTGGTARTTSPGRRSARGAQAQGHPGTPGEAADLTPRSDRGGAVEAAGAVDAKNAPTSSLENAKNAFPTAPTAFIIQSSMNELQKWYRGIPAGCVAPLSNTPGILGRRALPSGRRAPRSGPSSAWTDH
jgi:hypothetical protein